ncbi:TD and POZ domain-containing protein 1 [Caerostris darwini]|uniref:TD and POZ domain-containing protein 1 n=1 Tax=Caerostris darwini TaxID=1538125 RepID=A0AAV4RK17_9ARAC|nr:TD and POZ domain-containing protein 1 [Caerostris darwini]
MLSDIRIILGLCLFTIGVYQYFASNSSTGESFQVNDSYPRMAELFESMASLLESGTFSDLTIEAGKAKFQVHKAILSARSKVFHSMLQERKELNKITIEDMSEVAVGEMLSYIYTGHTKESSLDIVLELFCAGDVYKLELLKEICSDILVTNLNVDNVIDFLTLSSKHGDKKLEKSAVYFVAKNAINVRKNSNWLKFVGTHPRLADQVIEALCTKE